MAEEIERHRRRPAGLLHGGGGRGRSRPAPRRGLVHGARGSTTPAAPTTRRPGPSWSRRSTSTGPPAGGHRPPGPHQADARAVVPARHGDPPGRAGRGDPARHRRRARRPGRGRARRRPAPGGRWAGGPDGRRRGRGRQAGRAGRRTTWWPRPAACSAPARWATRARSTPTPPACWCWASGGPPGCSRSCRGWTSATPARSCWAPPRRPSTPRARSPARGTWPAVGLADVRVAAAGLTGDIDQVPPMVSAKKVDGRRLHELARAGVEVERAAVPVRVPGSRSASRWRRACTRSTSTCSSGTYIRSLAADLGAALGGGAHLRTCGGCRSARTGSTRRWRSRSWRPTACCRRSRRCAAARGWRSTTTWPPWWATARCWPPGCSGSRARARGGWSTGRLRCWPSTSPTGGDGQAGGGGGDRLSDPAASDRSCDRTCGEEAPGPAASVARNGPEPEGRRRGDGRAGPGRRRPDMTPRQV